MTGHVHEGHYQAFVWADERFSNTIFVDVTELLYGPVEDTMLGPAYRHKLGELLIEREYRVSPAAFAVALQADRSLAVTKDGRGVGNFPPALQPYIHQTLQEV